MEDQLKEIQEANPFLVERASSDHPAWNCPQENLLSCLAYLRDKLQFDFLTDVTAIDHFEDRPRFEVVYHLYATARHEYLRIVTPCADPETPTCPSVAELWPTADWHERETYDMFGVEFVGHPDLRRILMWDGYPFFPLRKEFPLAGKEVPLPSAELEEATGATAKPAPMMGGPFHAPQKGAMSSREPRADDESWNEIKERRSGGLDDKRDNPRDLEETQ
jgi:NADH-quinone oxidoreductase subunit C